NVRDIGAGTVRRDCYILGLKPNGDGGNHGVGRRVDDSDRVDTWNWERDIGARAVWSDCYTCWNSPNRDGGNHGVGRRINNSDRVSTFVGHIGAPHALR